MPSSHLILCRPLLLLPSIFPSIRVFSNESALHIRWPKYWRSPVAYWAPTNLGSSSFSILSFCLFILFMGFSRQEYWSVCHSFLQWTTFCQTSPPWPPPSRLGWPHTAWLSFIELDKAVVHAIRLVSGLWLWFLPSDALSQRLPSYLGFSYLGHGVSLHGCSSKAQPLLVTLDAGSCEGAQARPRGATPRQPTLK